MGKLWKVLIVAAMLALLPGCCLKHEWAEATCTAPKHCVKCGETEGEALGHTWRDATCTAPKTCATCGTTQGEALGHTWVDRTMEVPKTCSVCNATEGSPISCTEVLLKKIPVEMRDWVFFLGDRIYFSDLDTRTVYIYDSNENEIGKIVPPSEDVFHWTTGIYTEAALRGAGRLFTSEADAEGNCSVHVYDALGKEIASFPNLAKLPEGHYLAAENIGDDRYLNYFDKLGSSEELTPVVTIDCENMCVAPKEEVPAVRWFDAKKFSACWLLENCDDKYAMTASLDGKKMYLVHPVYYSIKAEYVDISGFNSLGYALVSADGVSYDLIDTDLNVVGKDVLPAGRRSDWRGETIIGVYKDDEWKYYSIK